MLHDEVDAPSEWIVRWVHLIPTGSRVLDVASGRGRHARWLAGLGFVVDAVDRDAAALATLEGVAGIEPLCADIESGPWPYAHQTFAAVIVTNYLHRPLFPDLIAAVAAGGVLIYETFSAGNERYGRPSNPNFLLRRGELLEVVRGRLEVIAYEDMHVERPRSAVVQRVCALKSTD
jgi:SAM-dependent methyltransferase